MFVIQLYVLTCPCWKPSWDKGSLAPHSSFSPGPSPMVLLLGCWKHSRVERCHEVRVQESFQIPMLRGPVLASGHTQSPHPRLSLLPPLPLPSSGSPIAPSSALPQDATLIWGFEPYSPWPWFHQQESSALPNFMEMSNS